MGERVRKWNGWGYEGEGIPRERVERWLATAGAWVGVRPEDYRPPVPLERLPLPPARVRPEIPGFRGAILATPYQRALHAAGRSYGDLVRLRTGRDLAFPDAVAYPEDEDDILRLLAYAEAEGIAVVPYGGGTSVVGGVEPRAPESFRGVITLDLRRLCRVREVDAVSRRARVQAGILGPDLEEALRAEGLAFRHYPQSFAHSTLGGWIAARAGGHFSTQLAKIEARVESVRVITPRGTLETREVPASASGPDATAWFAGGEGALGVITEAVLRVVVPPARKLAGGFRFPGFPAGLEAMRRIVQAGLRPAVLRLLDEHEVAMAAALNGRPLEPGALLHLSFELADADAEPRVHAEWEHARRLCEAAGGAEAPPAAVDTWKQAYFEQPHWRDVLVDFGFLVDTIETATVWSRVGAMYEGVRRRMLERLAAWSPVAGVMCRVTHAYPDGCSLYFTFFARPPREALWEAWRDVQRATLEAFLDHGGTLSHHHGTGRDFQPLFAREHGPLHVTALRGLKAALDPKGILNPGVFFAEREAP